MAPFGSRQDVGIDGRINLAKSGSKLKLPYVWLLPTSIGFGSIRAWELQRHRGQNSPIVLGLGMILLLIPHLLEARSCELLSQFLPCACSCSAGTFSYNIFAAGLHVQFYSGFLFWSHPILPRARDFFIFW